MYFVQTFDGERWEVQGVATFAEAAAIWLDAIQSGVTARIVQEVPLRIVPADQPARATRRASITDDVLALLSNGEPLTSQQVATRLHVSKRQASEALKYLVKQGTAIRVEVSPSDERGPAGVGRTTVTGYQLAGN